jgi:hypothetical protein
VAAACRAPVDPPLEELAKARQSRGGPLRRRAPGSTARETAAAGGGHSTGQVRDLAWTRPCAGGFPAVARDAPLPRDAPPQGSATAE